jgi:carbonic anhydrase
MNQIQRRKLNSLFKRNKAWAKGMVEENPNFFADLSIQQTPDYLWIGCADSRVPANQVVDLKPGEVFVHRNIANVVVHTDLNCLSVIQYAINVLEVKHIIVCGHYGCGGVKAAFQNQELGLIDNWLRHIKDVYRIHREEIDAQPSERERIDMLCEKNVIEQVANVCHTSLVQQAWRQNQDLTIHGWIYSIENGLLKSLDTEVSDAGDLFSMRTSY